MSHMIQGNFDGKGKKIAITVSSFNEFVSKSLVEGCTDMLKKHAVEDNDITVVWVPGSFEIPQAAGFLLTSGKKKFDAVICLGTLIRGDTPHFDYLAAEVTKGIAALALQHQTPVIYGIITADTLEQAVERAGTKQGNKGRDAAMAALEMIHVFKNITVK